MLTSNGLNNILKRIMASGELSDEMEKDIEAIRTDFSDKNNYLKKYGQVYEGDDKDEYDYTENESQVKPTEEPKYEQMYKDMKQKYIDRFFGGNPEEKEQEIIEDTKDDIESDEEEKTIDELFKKVEG